MCTAQVALGGTRLPPVRYASLAGMVRKSLLHRGRFMKPNIAFLELRAFTGRPDTRGVYGCLPSKVLHQQFAGPSYFVHALHSLSSWNCRASFKHMTMQFTVVVHSHTLGQRTATRRLDFRSCSAQSVLLPLPGHHNIWTPARPITERACGVGRAVCPGEQEASPSDGWEHKLWAPRQAVPCGPAA